MGCPMLKHRRKTYGRVALAVGLAGFLYTSPPQNVGEWAIAGAGAFVGLMAIDHLSTTYPDWSMPKFKGSGKTGCGCAK